MKKVLLSVAVLVALASFTSCKKCETCTGTAVTTWDNVPYDTTTVSGVEYCGDQLDLVKQGTTVTSTSLGTTITTKTTYSCSK